MQGDDGQHEGFVRVVTACVVLGMLVPFGSLIVDLDPRARTAVLSTFAWFVVLLPVHELGHALAARLTGAHIERISLGYGPRVLERELLGTRIVVRAYPVQGFVRIEDLRDHSRLARVFIYAAGVGAEALVVGAVVLVAGPASLFHQGAALPVLLAESGLLVLGLSVLANLVPRTATLEPNGRGGESNDGLQIVRALLGRS